jgi:hypothetical protein
MQCWGHVRRTRSPPKAPGPPIARDCCGDGGARASPAHALAGRIRPHRGRFDPTEPARGRATFLRAGDGFVGRRTGSCPGSRDGRAELLVAASCSASHHREQRRSRSAGGHRRWRFRGHRRDRRNGRRRQRWRGRQRRYGWARRRFALSGNAGASAGPISERFVRSEYVQRRTGMLQRKLWHLRGAGRLVQRPSLHRRPSATEHRSLRHDPMQYGADVLQRQLRDLRHARRNLLARRVQLIAHKLSTYCVIARSSSSLSTSPPNFGM